MTQQTFFDRPATRTAGPTAPFVATSETSRGAAETIAPCTGRLKALVLNFICERGQAGATDEELAGALGMLSDTARARRVELRDRGLIVDSGKRRSTLRGRAAVVWVVTDNVAERPCME